jgi:hypothetical protein
VLAHSGVEALGRLLKQDFALIIHDAWDGSLRDRLASTRSV